MAFWNLWFPRKKIIRVQNEIWLTGNKAVCYIKKLKVDRLNWGFKIIIYQYLNTRFVLIPTLFVYQTVQKWNRQNKA